MTFLFLYTNEKKSYSKRYILLFYMDVEDFQIAKYVSHFIYIYFTIKLVFFYYLHIYHGLFLHI